MKVVVKLFAGARETVGHSEVEVEVGAGANIGQLRQLLSESHPQMQTLLTHAMFAIDATYASDETPIPSDAELACIPPVSGG